MTPAVRTDTGGDRVAAGRAGALTTTLAAWGEFLGGIAVVVSLIYLASQIRQNSNLLRASTASATSQIEYQQNALMVQDEEVARIFWEGLADRASLSEKDRRRLCTSAKHSGQATLFAKRQFLIFG